MTNDKISPSIEKEINLIIDQLKAINNRDRRKILELCKDSPMTIMQLVRTLKSSNKVTWNNVMQLNHAGFVILEKPEKEQYHPVYVHSTIIVQEIVALFAKTTEQLQQIIEDKINDRFKEIRKHLISTKKKTNGPKRQIKQRRYTNENRKQS